MTPPPKKRQRRSILSDDDSPALKTRRLPQSPSLLSETILPERDPIKQNGAPKKTTASFSARASRKSSPEKASRRNSKPEKDSKSLHIFFGTATEEQRWARKDRPPHPVTDDGEAGDAIEDDSLDEAFAELLDGEGDEDKILDRRKATEGPPRNWAPVPVKKFPGSNLRFAEPSKPATRERRAISGLDDELLNQPWAERFAPTSLEELAVHKKKVTDVQNWLSAVLQGRDRRVCNSCSIESSC